MNRLMECCIGWHPLHRYTASMIRMYRLGGPTNFMPHQYQLGRFRTGKWLLVPLRNSAGQFILLTCRRLSVPTPRA